MVRKNAFVVIALVTLFWAAAVSGAVINVTWTARYDYMGVADWIDWGGFCTCRSQLSETFVDVTGEMKDFNDLTDTWIDVSASRYNQNYSNNLDIWTWEVDGWANMYGWAVVRGRLNYLDGNQQPQKTYSNEVGPF